MANLIHLIYSSTPFGYDPADLNGILLNARRNNARDDISGALICRRDVFIQYLEGPASLVESTYGRIIRDDRHVEVKLRSKGPINARVFGDWAMLHDPAQSVIWTMEEVDAGAMEGADAAQYRNIFDNLAQTVA